MGKEAGASVRTGRRRFLRNSVAGLAGLALGGGWRQALATPARRSARRPNVLIIYADQLRFHALGCNGNPVARTDQIGALASSGTVVSNSFTCSPMCTPARAQLMTGRYGSATGVVTNDVKLPTTETTLAESLGLNGYQTGYIGKWHLNAGRVSQDEAELAGYVRPRDRQGWQHWAAIECEHSYFGGRYYRDSPTPVRFKGYEPAVQTKMAIQFMREPRDEPFCLMISFGIPHDSARSYQPPKSFDIYQPGDVVLRPNVPEAYAPRARKFIAQYYGLIASLDEMVGRLLRALDDLELADDTIVCFYSDHGDMLFSHGQRFKDRPFEESIRVPLILRYPAKIPAGKSSEVLFGSVDVMPTILGLCGVDVPPRVQGRDLSPQLLGDEATGPDSVFLEYTYKRGIKFQTLGADWRGVRTSEWTYAYHSKGDWVLYNNREDPYQLANLAGDPQYRTRRNELRAILNDKRTELKDEAVLEMETAPFSRWNRS